MLSVIIKDDGEENVVALTYQNLWREIKDIPDAELLVSHDWFSALPKVNNKYVCFVEADCLVSSGYFSSMVGLLKKSRMLRKLAMLSSSTAVVDWPNKFYGYSIGGKWSDETNDKIQTYNKFVQPNKQPKSRGLYPVQIGYVPGSIIRVSTLMDLIAKTGIDGRWNDDLVFLSSQISLGFWDMGDGNRVHLNPNSTYLSTEKYVNDLSESLPKFSHDLVGMFQRETIS